MNEWLAGEVAWMDIFAVAGAFLLGYIITIAIKIWRIHRLWNGMTPMDIEKVKQIIRKMK